MAKQLRRNGQPEKRRKLTRKKVAPLPTATPIELEALQTQQLPLRTHVLKNGLTFNNSTYEFDDSFTPMKTTNPFEAHTFSELIYCLENNKDVEIEATVLSPKGYVKIEGRKAFLEAHKRAEKAYPSFNKFKESMRSAKQKENDYFATNTYSVPNGVDSQDFAPLLGGPFFKQLYPYDYLRMISNCFYAWHHDPVAKDAIAIIRNFVLGRGFAVDCENKTALALWDAFVQVNDLEAMIENHVDELEVYGESMIWKLPKNEAFISYQRRPGQEPPKGIIPRVRLIDPSCIWEIVTYPEDIKQVLFYQWVAPTQYQTYTAPDVPSTKFIMTQIPADQVLHVKINCASNEKRGRSELFASLGYLKRLRDYTNYSLVTAQKNAAWSIDTIIDGSQADIDRYSASQAALGTLPPAGSEFVHSKKVERKYLSNEGGKGGLSNAFECALSMAAIGLGIPVSYFGSHLSGGQTRASALISTEPVAKMFESRRLTVERTIKHLFYWLTGEQATVTFPELITQDRDAKIRAIVMGETSGYISKQRAAQLYAKELDISDFDFETEQQDMSGQTVSSSLANPLTNPGLAKKTLSPKPSQITSDQKKSIKDEQRT